MNRELEKYIYHKEDAGVIYCGDCREILPLLDKVDLVLTDPPYNAKNIGSDCKVYENTIMQLSDEDYSQFCREWFTLSESKSEGMVFSSGIRNIWKYPAAKWVICWHKPGAVSYNGTGGLNIWEPILLYGKCGRFTEDFIKKVPLNLDNAIEHQHPCPKNKFVWSWLINQASKEGGG